MKIVLWISYLVALSLCFQLSFCDLYTQIYAGGKTSRECMEGPRDKASKYQLTTAEKIELEGYPVETHMVLTEDGYALTLHRIPPNSLNKNDKISAPIPIFLQHGLTLNSYYWVGNGKNKSLPFFLADYGYDVWMGNFRGALYSRCHISLTTSNEKYWDFSFHQMGVYDFPTMILYVANVTNKKVEVVGHSLGTTAFYIFAAEKPDIATKVSMMHSFGPTAFLKNMKGLAVPLVYTSQLYGLIGAGNTAVILELNIFRYFIYDLFCGLPISRNICEFFFFATVGFDWNQFDTTKLPYYLNHFPTGISVGSVYHYSQIKMSGRFQKYDYGAAKNRKLYGSDEPPDYDLSSIQVPMALYKGQNDFLCALEDVDHLVDLLPNVKHNYLVNYTNFNHMDFVIAKEAREILYKPFLSVLKSRTT